MVSRGDEAIVRATQCPGGHRTMVHMHSGCGGEGQAADEDPAQCGGDERA